MAQNDDIDVLTAKAEEQAKRLRERPLYEQIIVKSTLHHLRNGAYWGFDNDIETRLSLVAEDLRDSGTKIAIVLNLRRGGIVEVNSFETAVKIMRSVVGIEGFSDRLYADALKMTEKDILQLIEFCRAGKTGTVGFYNTNQTGSIIVNGVTLPSFRLNAQNFLGILSREGYKVETATGVKGTAEQALENIRGFMKDLDKAPSGNSVLVKISK